MANKFVWSGAGGLNDGSSWDNAYTTLMKDWGAEAGFTPATDYVYVRSVHSEASATTLTITGSTAEGTTAVCRIVCVVGDITGTTPGNLATGASVSTNTTSGNIYIDEGLYIYGVSFFSNNDVGIGNSTTDHDICLDSCRIELIGVVADALYVGGQGGVSVSNRVVCKNTVFDFAAANQYVAFRSVKWWWIGGSIEYDLNTPFAYPALANNGLSVVGLIGVDFSVLTSSPLIDGGANVGGMVLTYLSRCLLASGASLVTGTIDVPGFRVESYHCQIGTDADPSYQMEIQDSRGKVSANTAKYRTGGASDGVRSTPISWDFDTTVGSVRGYPGHAFEGPPITAWTAGDGSTAHTYRIAFASDATINDDEFWIELEGPNDAATNSLAALKTTRVAPMTTAAACTTDGTSTWNGTGVTTKQYVEVTYTPDKPGPVTVRCYMAKASDNIYVDPKIQIDP